MFDCLISFPMLAIDGYSLIFPICDMRVLPGPLVDYETDI